MSNQNFLATVRSKKNGDKLRSREGVFPIERRKHPRFSIEFPLDYSIVDGKPTYHGGLTADASERGLLVYLPERIEIGTLLRIEIFYITGLSLEAITATAKVVWSDFASQKSWGKNRYGLEFQFIDERNLQKLKTLLEDVIDTLFLR